MMISMLVDMLLSISRLRVISCNTDGICLYLNRSDYPRFKEITSEWERITRLNLEEVRYKKIVVADVNSYIAEYDNEDKY